MFTPQRFLFSMKFELPGESLLDFDLIIWRMIYLFFIKHLFLSSIERDLI